MLTTEPVDTTNNKNPVAFRLNYKTGKKWEGLELAGTHFFLFFFLVSIQIYRLNVLLLSTPSSFVLPVHSHFTQTHKGKQSGPKCSTSTFLYCTFRFSSLAQVVSILVWPPGGLEAEWVTARLLDCGWGEAHTIFFVLFSSTHRET